MTPAKSNDPLYELMYKIQGSIATLKWAAGALTASISMVCGMLWYTYNLEKTMIINRIQGLEAKVDGIERGIHGTKKPVEKAPTAVE